MKLQHIARSAITLTLFAVIGTGVVAFTHSQTRDRVAENERQALLRNLFQVVARERLDNELLTDSVLVTDPLRLGSKKPVRVYLARKGERPVAAIFESVAPDGYSGTIRLLVGVDYGGTVSAVRVLSHKETPGLGDWIETAKSDWIHAFAGKSLASPDEARWAVKKDGGVFDQFTGATITPRAVVNAVRNTLDYYREHRDALFPPAAKGGPRHG